MAGSARLRGDERGQLLLVGAVSIALIVLGLVVVYNTILFTDTREPVQTLDDSADVATLQAQTVNDTQRLVEYVNEDTGYNCSGGNATALENYIEGNLTGASSTARGLTNVTAIGGVRFVNLNDATADCSVGGADEVRVEIELVVRTPEADYETELTRVYEVDP